MTYLEQLALDAAFAAWRHILATRLIRRGQPQLAAILRDDVRDLSPRPKMVHT